MTFQNVIKSILFTVAGILFLGSLFDNISNSRDLIDLRLAVIFTLVIFISWILLLFWMKKNKPYWGSGENKIRLTKPNKQINLFALGMIILLWFPIFFPKRQEIQRPGFGTTQRPDNIPYSSFFINRNLFTVIQYFPFDLHLNISSQEFSTLYPGIVEEYETPLEKVRLFGIKKGSLKYNAEGKIDEANTFFLFHEDILSFVNLSMIINPAREDELYDKFFQEFSQGTGNVQNQGSNYYWLSKERVYSETLNWFHGYSSGNNSFRLFRNDYLTNDLPIELFNFYDDINNAMTSYPEFTMALENCKSIIATPDYEKYIFKKFDIAPVVVGSAIETYERFISELNLLKKIWNKPRKENNKPETYSTNNSKKLEAALSSFEIQDFHNSFITYLEVYDSLPKEIKKQIGVQKINEAIQKDIRGEWDEAAWIMKSIFEDSEFDFHN